MRKIEGVITALVTPFLNSKIDFESLKNLVEFQVKKGINGFVINGTTAESPTLEESEVIEIFKCVRNWVPAECSLILGTGSNSTKKTVENTKRAFDLGADASLVVVPYYNKPPQRGLETHFKEVAKATELPIILYNVPGRTITSLSVETIKKLSDVKNIVGIKEATGDISFLKEVISCTRKDFIFLSGDDGTYPDFLSAGGMGVISVASHILPSEFIRITELAKEKKYQEEKSFFEEFSKLIELLFIEPNPIPVKKALEFMGIIKSSECRLPLVEMDRGPQKLLQDEMKRVGIL